MAVRKDTVQLNIEFITDESRALAKANVDTKALTTELRKAVREGGDVADVLRRIEAAGKDVTNIDLTKVAPAQLITRAGQLRTALTQIPESNPQFATLNGELKRINDRLANVRQSSRGVADAIEKDQGGGILGAFKRVQIAALAFLAAFAGAFSFGRQIIAATSQFQTFGAVLTRELGSKSAAQQAIRELTRLADDLGKPAEDIIASYTKLVSRGLKPTTDELRKIVDLAASQGKEVDQLTEALLDAGTLEFERLKEFGIRAKQSGDRVALSFKGQTIEVEKNQTAILNAIIGFGELQGVQGAAADGADNLGGKVARLTGFFDRFLANLGQGKLGRIIGGALDAATDLVGVFVDLTEVQQDVTREVRNSQAAFNLEIETLKSGNLSTEARAKLIERINTRYGEYLPNLLSEESTLGDIAAAQNAVNKSFEQRIILLAAEEQLTEISRRRLDVKSKELELELSLTAAKQKALEVTEREENSLRLGSKEAVGNFGRQQGAAAGANKAQEALNENKRQQIALEKEFQDQLAAAKSLGLDIDSILNPDAGRPRGSTDEGKKQTLSDRLKVIEEASNVERELAERALLGNELTEKEYAARLREIDAANYTSQLEAYAEFGQARLAAAEALRNDLLRLQQGRNTPAAVQAIAAGEETTTVDRRAQNAQLDAVNAQAEREADALQRQRNARNISEEQFELARQELKRNLLAQEVEILRTGTDEEIQLAADKAEQIKDIEQDIFDRKADLAEREKELRRSVTETAIQAGGEALDAAIGFLGRDEDARKRNAGLLKNFQKGQAILSGLNELQQIRLATAAQAASVAAIPGASIGAYIAGAVRAAKAIATTAATVGKINATQFARGGLPKFGVFGGKSHAAGGNQGYFEDGTQINVEAGETFAIVNKRARGLLGFLSDTNVATGGVPFFARGGLPFGAADITPRISPGTLNTNNPTAAVPDNSDIVQAIQQLQQITAAQQLTLAFTDIETTASDLNAVRVAAQV